MSPARRALLTRLAKSPDGLSASLDSAERSLARRMAEDSQFVMRTYAGRIGYHITEAGMAYLAQLRRYTPLDVGDTVFIKGASMPGVVLRIIPLSYLLSDGASRAQVRVRWASGSEATHPEAQLGKVGSP